MQRWVIVTRFVTDGGRVIRHVYDNNGEAFATRAKAQTGVARILREDARYVDDIDAVLANGRLEIVPVRIVEVPSA